MMRAAVLGVLLVAINACAPGSPSITNVQPLAAPQSSTTPSPAPTQTAAPDNATTVPPVTQPGSETIAEAEVLVDIELAEVADLGGEKPPEPHDPLIAATIADLEQWSIEMFPDLYGEPFESLEGTIYVGWSGRETIIPGCRFSTELPLDTLAVVGGIYCIDDDFIAFDASRSSMLGALAQEHGGAVYSLMLAHEWAHVIQKRTGALDRPLPHIITEQQADCFAGAWVRRAYLGESDLLRLGDRDVNASLLALLDLRDPVGTDQLTEFGHGSAFDRVGAFQEGFTKGPEGCEPLIDDPLPLMPNVFQPGSRDEKLGGDARYNCLYSNPFEPDACSPAPVVIASDLNHFWQTELGSFPELSVVPEATINDAICDDAVFVSPLVALCPSGGRVVFDEPAIIDLYEAHGDFTLGYLMGIAWADQVLRKLGVELVNRPRALLRDCLAGAWVADITPDENGSTNRPGDRDGDGTNDAIRTSPGDFDEAIFVALQLGDERSTDDRFGTPFEKVDWFRHGVLTDVERCLERAGVTER